MIIVRTPLRVSFFGGGTDHPAWLRRGERGGVLSTTIDKYVYVQLRKLPAVFDFNYRVAWGKLEEVQSVSEIQHPVVRTVLEHYGADDESGYEVIYNADLPSRSGLGSSSSFTVSMLHAFLGDHGRLCSKRFLASEAIRVEQELLREPVGCQDQVAAAYGGFNRIEFDPSGDFTVTPVRLSAGRRAALESHLMMFFTGFIRSASAVEATKIDSMDARTTELRALYALADEGQNLLEQETAPIEEFGALLDDAWRNKRRLSDSVSNDSIDAAYETARAAGAIGGKLLGAGGGGFLLIFAPPEAQPRVRAALQHFVHVPFCTEREGASVVLYAPELDRNYETSVARMR